MVDFKRVMTTGRLVQIVGVGLILVATVLVFSGLNTGDRNTAAPVLLILGLVVLVLGINMNKKATRAVDTKKER